ncbi:exopolysaccharide inner membrane protein, partial [Colletotrichum sojae]
AFRSPWRLHSARDFNRIKRHVEAKEQLWYKARKHLESTKLAQTSWVPSPKAVPVRGSNATFTEPKQNYASAYRDAHSAYQLTLRWLIGGNTSYADHAAAILDGWSATLTDIDGTEDKCLAAGIYGYQFPNAAEILRAYPGWP